MDRTVKYRPIEPGRTASKPSAVKAVLSWLVETDREFRVAQSMVNDTHDRI